MKKILYTTTTLLVLSVSILMGAQINYELAIDEAYNTDGINITAEEVMMRYGFYGQMIEKVTLEDKLEAIANVIFED